MALKYPELFSPFQIGKLKIKNRIAMSPMHLGGRPDSDGNLNDEIIDFYEARAKGGIGLIYTGGFLAANGVEDKYTNIDPFSDVIKFRSKISRLAEKVHAYDTKLFVELGIGAGRVIFPNTMTPRMNGRSVAPSEVENRWDPNIICRALETEEIYGLIEAQINAAVKISTTGADGICIAGPYGGYFADQFMIKLFNHRDDEFGYAQNGYHRVITDAIKGIKKKCGKDFIVDVRMTPVHYMKGLRTAPLPGEEYVEQGRSIEESIELAKELEAAGADSLLIGGGSYDSFYWLYPPVYQKEGIWLEDAHKIKEAVNIPVICPGKILTPEMANDAIKNGYVDCVAIGRASLADAEWPNKARTGRSEDIRPCIGCQNGCIGNVFTGGLVTCAVNPQMFYEKTDPITPAAEKKHVVVIGGGVAGMEAARIAAIRGHDVDLYEKESRLGGLFNLAAVPEFKFADHRLLEWYPRALEHAGVKVHLNSEISAKDVDALKADEVIVATGARPRVMKFSGIDENSIITASDVLAGRETGNNCVIIGGGLVGCEVAIWLARKGKKVTLIEALPELMSAGAAVPLPNKLMVLDMLKGGGVDVFVNARFTGCEGGKSMFSDASGSHAVEADSIIQAIGFVPNDELYNELYDFSPAGVWNIGDSREPNNVMLSVREGFYIGKTI